MLSLSEIAKSGSLLNRSVWCVMNCLWFHFCSSSSDCISKRTGCCI